MPAERIERDSLGEIAVPENKYWGAQTQRSLDNCPIGWHKIPLELIYALTIVKKAVAITNTSLGLLSQEKADLINGVCDEILAGKLNDQFLLSVWQTGSGTHTNMNVNEVISNRANQKADRSLGCKYPIHPNDDVNMCQSSNDTFPTAMHIAATLLIQKSLLPNLKTLLAGFNTKVKEFWKIIKVGRTHLMDATPLTLGQEFSGYAAQIRQAIEAIERNLVPLSQLAIGGTAVGTGLNTPPQFAERAAAEIAHLTGYPFTSAPNKFAAIASQDAIVGMSGALRQTATAFLKIANDIRWLASGPRCGLEEIILPLNNPGSSIMPGKNNPVQCEAMTMVAVQVMGDDLTIALASSMGNFELNTFRPVIIYNLLESIHLLADTAVSFHDKCLIDIQPNLKKINENLNHSLMMATVLNTAIGYDKASEVVKKAERENISLKEAVLILGFLTEEQFYKIVDPEKMINLSFSEEEDRD